MKAPIPPPPDRFSIPNITCPIKRYSPLLYRSNRYPHLLSSSIRILAPFVQKTISIPNSTIPNPGYMPSRMSAKKQKPSRAVRPEAAGTAVRKQALQRGPDLYTLSKSGWHDHMLKNVLQSFVGDRLVVGHEKKRFLVSYVVCRPYGGDPFVLLRHGRMYAFVEEE